MKWVAENGREIGVDGSRLAWPNSVGEQHVAGGGSSGQGSRRTAVRTLVLMWPVTDAGYDWDSYVEYGRQRFLTAP